MEIESTIIEGTSADDDVGAGTKAAKVPSETARLSQCSSDEDCQSVSSLLSTEQEKSFDDPTTMITDEMLEEEKRLSNKGIEDEEKRKEEELKLYTEMTNNSKEKRYEKLKYLLSRSSMYANYLIGRMKKQREQEQNRLEKLKATKSITTSKEKEPRSPKEEITPSQVSKRSKRKIAREETSTVIVKKRKLRSSQNANSQDTTDSQDGNSQDETVTETSSQRELRSTPPSSQKEVKNSKEKEKFMLKNQNEIKAKVDDVKSTTGAYQEITAENRNKDEQETKISEMASTFGVTQEENRFIDGQQVPFLQPKLMTGGILRPYQVEGYSWLKVLYENGVNGILADEMGLGKTLQCVAILSHLAWMGVKGPYLVVAPLSTLPNWVSEFQRFAPKIPVVLYHGLRQQRSQLAKKFRRAHLIRDKVFSLPVVVTSYEIAMIDKKILAHNDWKYMIVDEGHRIKNAHCRLIRDLRTYNSANRIILTGTPLQNNLAELWSLLNFLLPEIFDDLGSFEAWFDVKYMNDANSDDQIVQQERGNHVLSMMHQILSPFMLRRLKSDVALSIPPKKEVLVYAPMMKEQTDYYSALVNRTIFSFIKEKNKAEEEPVKLNSAGRPKRRATKNIDYSLMMEDVTEKRSFNQSVSQKRWTTLEKEEDDLENWIYAVSNNKPDKEKTQETVKKSQVNVKMRNIMMQLRKCCNHPYLIEHPVDEENGELALTENVIKSCGKMQIVDTMLCELKKRGHRVLIFSQMTRMLDLLEDFCVIRNYNFCRLDGSTAMEMRKKTMEEFNEKGSDIFVFLLSTRAGGLGVNLVGADTVIIYDSDWNPQCDLQAQDRCHRIGQTKPVVVYRLVSANTIDQKIIERAAAKRKLEKMIIHKGKFKSGSFSSKQKPISPQELQELLKSKDHMSELKGEASISQEDLNLLLDRSDLETKWRENVSKSSGEESSKTKSKKNARSSKKESNTGGKSQLFEVVDIDSGLSVTDKDKKKSTNLQE